MVSVELVYSLALNTFFRPADVVVFFVFFNASKGITSLIWFRNCFELGGKTHAHVFFCLVFSSHNHNSDRKNMEFIDRIHKSLSKPVVDNNSTVLRHTGNESDRECFETLLLLGTIDYTTDRNVQHWNELPHISPLKPKWTAQHFVPQSLAAIAIAITDCIWFVHLLLISRYICTFFPVAFHLACSLSWLHLYPSKWSIYVMGPM